MKTDVFDDILCLLVGDDLQILRNEFQAVINTLDLAGISYFLIGDIAISEYRNPFATTTVEIQLLNHSLIKVSSLISALNLNLSGQDNTLIVNSKQQTGREYNYYIYLHAPISWVTEHYKKGATALVLGQKDIPVADIRVLVWYQVMRMLHGDKHKKQQYKVHLRYLLNSDYCKQDEVRNWLINNNQRDFMQRLDTVIVEMQEEKPHKGLTWAEVQERKRKLHTLTRRPR